MSDVPSALVPCTTATTTVAPAMPATITRRGAMRSGARLIAAGAACLAVPAVLSQSKRYAGVTLNVSCWSAAYPVALSNYIAEFEALSGAKVNYDTPGFQIYNQRADLELSTKGAGFDVLNITFVFTNRWIGNGWFAPLEPFLSDPNKTPADYDFADFLTGAVSPLRDSKGAGFGVPWVTDSAMAIATRYDLLQANGLQMPDTFDELEKAAATLHKKDGVDGFLADNHWGFWYPPFLQGYGGNVFRAPPDDLMPTLATPEAIHAAEQLSRIVGKYSTAGAAGMSYGQTQELLRSGKANLSLVTHVGGTYHATPESKVARTLRFGLYPRGPKGRFPGIAAHGWGIPAGSRNKDAAWAFIGWATSKAMFAKLVKERNLGSVTRRSVFESPDYQKLIMVNGVDTGRLVLDTIKLGEQGHMKYRTVPVYPQVNVQINQALGRIITGQMSAKESMNQAQTAVMADLKRAGVKL